MDTEVVSQFFSPEGITVEERAQVKQGSENVLVFYSLCVIDFDIAMLIHLIAVRLTMCIGRALPKREKDRRD
jgi:hypothetical protein